MIKQTRYGMEVHIFSEGRARCVDVIDNEEDELVFEEGLTYVCQRCEDLLGSYVRVYYDPDNYYVFVPDDFRDSFTVIGESRVVGPDIVDDFSE